LAEHEQSHDLRLAEKSAKVVTKAIRPLGERYGPRTVTNRETFARGYAAKRKHSDKASPGPRRKAAKVA